jgi:TRAP-type C4-dicarboxylate transport system permease small subunit
VTEKPSPTTEEYERGRLFHWIGAIEDTVLVLLLGGMLVLALLQIILRNFADTAILWADPALRIGVLWIGLLGAVAASRDGRHITVDALSRALPLKLKKIAGMVSDLFTVTVTLVLAWHAGRLVLEDRSYGVTAFAEVPVWLCELILPVAFVLIAIRHTLMLVHRFSKRSPAP